MIQPKQNHSFVLQFKKIAYNINMSVLNVLPAMLIWNPLSQGGNCWQYSNPVFKYPNSLPDIGKQVGTEPRAMISTLKTTMIFNKNVEVNYGVQFNYSFQCYS